MNKHLIVLSGGVGSRFGESTPKQYYRNEHGHMIITNSCLPFIGKGFSSITFVASDEFWDEIKNEISPFFEKETKFMFTKGGKTRQDSINNGVRKVKETFGKDRENFIFLQEAVRPFVSSDLVDRLINAPKEWNNVSPAIHPAVLYGWSKDGKVSELISKNAIVELQLPKRYSLDALFELIEKNNYDAATLVDESELFIKNGDVIHTIEGIHFNVKITFPEHKQLHKKG